VTSALWARLRSGRALILIPLTGLWISASVPMAAAHEVYVGNGGSSSVSVIDTATNQVVGSPIPVGLGPFGMAITPDARTAYVANIDVGLVKAIDVGTKQVAGTPIEVGGGPEGIAITPDGTRAYVATNGGERVAVIDTADNFVGPPIPVAGDPDSVAITPDGRSAYVTDLTSGDVSVIDTAANQVVGPPIPVGSSPRGIAITPDGSRAYVANSGSKTVSVIDTATNQVVGPPIEVENEPYAVAVTPDGSRVYVTNRGMGTVSVIDTATNQVVGPPIQLTGEPTAIAITPDGTRAYVTNGMSGIVAVIETATNQVVGPPIMVGTAPESIAITPDQPPLAAFTGSVARPGVPIVFSAAASRDQDGSISRYSWDFGDGQTVPDGGPSPGHTYSKPGSYRVTLTVTDNDGCSTSLRYTGQTAYCNGSAAARLTQTVSVAYPAVRVRCPKGAGRSGCRFKLIAVTKRRKGRAMTKVARGRAKAGRSALISLKPKSRFAARLAPARKILIRETVTFGGATRTRYVKAGVAN
jgi:YVTN family beta-propeller protein